MKRFKKILVIGGGGFIGTNLVSRFLKNEDYRIVIFEVPGFSSSIYENYGVRVSLITGELSDIDLFKNIINKYSIDIVFHLVSSLLPSSTFEEYEEELYNVVKPTINIIHLCAIQKVQFVYFSSGGTIYGDTGDVFHKETDFIAPISYYGLSKCNIENAILTENMRNLLPYLILRPSNPYGHGQRLNGKQGLIAVVIGKILKNEAVELWGDGTNVRDYIYIDDLIEYVYQLIKKGIVNEIFNLGSGCAYTTKEIIETVYEVAKTEMKVVELPTQFGAVKSVVLDMQKLARYIPLHVTSLKEGIEIFYNESINVAKER